ncbi:MAG: thiol:disulfide interchange protein DsbA/DsbL [Pseudoxanthomonas suwonensis]|nr:thiol:disulfide interchange protein DsbA/DsbL [Pseudoxanthomonas suwonensis]
MKIAHRFPLYALALLLALLPLAALAQASATVPKAGVDYVLIENGKPFAPLDGKIEVVEVFSYTCGHCAQFQPMLDAWKARQRDDVRVTYLPLATGPGDHLSRAFFALQDTGELDRGHAATFRAIHERGALSRRPEAAELAAFYTGLGLDGTALQRAMAEESVTTRMAAAYRHALNQGVEGTPTVIVNGRYRVTARTHEDRLRIADALIARLRTQRR